MRTFSISCRLGVKKQLHKLWPVQEMSARAVHFERVARGVPAGRIFAGAF
jgi:hypothetical protein